MFHVHDSYFAHSGFFHSLWKVLVMNDSRGEDSGVKRRALVYYQENTVIRSGFTPHSLRSRARSSLLPGFQPVSSYLCLGLLSWQQPQPTPDPFRLCLDSDKSRDYGVLSITSDSFIVFTSATSPSWLSVSCVPFPHLFMVTIICSIWHVICHGCRCHMVTTLARCNC